MADPVTKDVKRHDEEAPVSEPEPQTIRGTEVAKVISQTGAQGAMRVIAEADIGPAKADEYPDAPANGFSGPDDYSKFIGKMNAKAVKDQAEFKAHPEKYRLRDPENPDKFMAMTIHTCADGRCNPALYTKKELEYLNLNWQPAAGLIYFPEISVDNSRDGIVQQLTSDPAKKKMVFDRMDMMYGPSIAEFLEEYKAGVTSRYLIEFQAHFDSNHHPKHGCGAHKSNLANAQKESIKNAVLAETWLKERYPEQFQKGLFCVSRSVQDNRAEGFAKNNPLKDEKDDSKNGHVYEGSHIDSLLSAEDKGDFAPLFEEVTDKYVSPGIADKNKHIVRPFSGNPFGIDTAEHSEQGVRVSMFQWANTLNGQSAMEICWTNDPVTLQGHLNVLLGIIADNKFSNANRDKPHYLHLDLVKGDPRTKAVYEQLRKAMENDPKIKSRLDDGSLFLKVTETDRATMKSEGIA